MRTEGQSFSPERGRSGESDRINRLRKRIDAGIASMDAAHQHMQEELRTAHEKGNKEAEQRNGHLADLVVKTNKRTIEAVQVVHKQKVEHQDVHEATLNKTRFKNE